MTNDNTISLIQTVSTVEEELLGSRMARTFHVPIEMIHAQPDAGAAFSLACTASGLTDKEIYTDPDVDMDQGYFSNCKTGKATLQGNKLAGFCRRVGNIVYLEWLSYSCGYTNVMIKSEVERQLDAATKALEDERLKNRVLLEALSGKVLA